jgi:hypothetical protein
LPFFATFSPSSVGSTEGRRIGRRHSSPIRIPLFGTGVKPTVHRGWSGGVSILTSLDE